MKNSKLKNFKLLLVGSLLISACSRINNVNLPVADSTPKLVDTRLAFKNVSTFNEYLDEIMVSKDIPGETSKVGLVSLASKYHIYDLKAARLAKSDSSNTILPDSLRIPDPLLNAIVNEKGEVEVGKDTIYKFTYHFSYKFHKSLLDDVEKIDTASLKSIEKGKGIYLQNGVYAFRNQIKSYAQSTSANRSSARTEATSQTPAPLTGDTRMVADVYTFFAGFYASAVIYTKVEREKCNYIFNWCYSKYWGAENARVLGYRGTVRYKRVTTGIVVESGSRYFNESAANQSEKSETFLKVLTFISPYEITYRDTYHFATTNGGSNSIYNP